MDPTLIVVPKLQFSITHWKTLNVATHGKKTVGVSQCQDASLTQALPCLRGHYPACHSSIVA